MGTKMGSAAVASPAAPVATSAPVHEAPPTHSRVPASATALIAPMSLAARVETLEMAVSNIGAKLSALEEEIGEMRGILANILATTAQAPALTPHPPAGPPPRWLISPPPIGAKRPRSRAPSQERPDKQKRIGTATSLGEGPRPFDRPRLQH